MRALFTFTRGEMRGVLWLLPLLAAVGTVIVAANRPQFEESFLEQTNKETVRAGMQERQRETQTPPESERYIMGNESRAQRDNEPWRGGNQTIGEHHKIAGYQSNGLIELNSADLTILRSVNGIDGELIASIINYRARLGGYARVEQLAEVYGMTQEDYERIRQQIFVDSCIIQKIDINFASHQIVVDALGNHPYIDSRGLRKLLKNRQLKGGWRTIEDMVDENIVTSEQAERLAPYLIFSTE